MLEAKPLGCMGVWHVRAGANLRDPNGRCLPVTVSISTGLDCFTSTVFKGLHASAGSVEIGFDHFFMCFSS